MAGVRFASQPERSDTPSPAVTGLLEGGQASHTPAATPDGALASGSSVDVGPPSRQDRGSIRQQERMWVWGMQIPQQIRRCALKLRGKFP
jgi:hypothetical protein